MAVGEIYITFTTLETVNSKPVTLYETFNVSLASRPRYGLFARTTKLLRDRDDGCFRTRPRELRHA